MPRPPTPEAQAARESIVRILREYGSMNFGRICFHLGEAVHTKLASNSLQLLKSYGHVEYRKKSNEWALTAKARETIL